MRGLQGDDGGPFQGLHEGDWGNTHIIPYTHPGFRVKDFE